MKIMRTVLALALFLLPSVAGAQQQRQMLSPEQEEKQMREAIEQLVVKYEEELKLEVWQTFYVDSILTHNTFAMRDETRKLADNRVENYDLYMVVSDKWDEATYSAFRKLFTDEQWAKYLKSGAARAKKARDKRAEKREGKQK